MANRPENVAMETDVVDTSENQGWFPELCKLGFNLDGFEQPHTATQYLLVFLAATHPACVKLVLAKEAEIMDNLRGRPEDRQNGMNNRPLCLFGQVEIRDWLKIVWKIRAFPLQDSTRTMRDWIDTNVRELSNMASAEVRTTWQMMRWSQEYDRVKGNTASYLNITELGEPIVDLSDTLVSDKTKAMLSSLAPKPDEHIDGAPVDLILNGEPSYDPANDMTGWKYPFATTRILDAFSTKIPNEYKFWCMTNPLGWTSPFDAMDWIQLSALLRKDAAAWVERAKSTAFKQAVAGNFSFKSRTEFLKPDGTPWYQQQFGSECQSTAMLWNKTWNLDQGGQLTWNQLRPYVKCGCCKGNIVWFDSLMWYMMNHLDEFWPDEDLSAYDQFVLFLGLLTAYQNVVLQMACFCMAREWVQKAAIEVATHPMGPDLEFIPDGVTKKNILHFVPAKRYSPPVKADDGLFSPASKSSGKNGKTPRRGRFGKSQQGSSSSTVVNELVDASFGHLHALETPQSGKRPSQDQSTPASSNKRRFAGGRGRK